MGHYLVTIGYQTEDQKGNMKLKKEKYVMEADSVEESTLVVAKYCAGDTRDSELLSVVQLPVECVISPKSHPEYYKGK